jgi:MFS family permease
MSLNAIVILWCIYHLLEYIGTVYLWAWLGDISPRRIRGRFIARRERWMLILRIMGMLGGGAFSAMWLDEGIRDYDWMAYAIPSCAGAAWMMLAIVPLLRMPEPATTAEQAANPLPLAGWWQPLANRNMLWLLAFGAWFSLANGLTQSAQFLFPLTFFGLSLFARQSLEASMRFAQSLGAVRVGRIADFFGNRWLLVVSQLIVAFGPLSLFIASRTRPDEPPVYNDGSHWWNYHSDAFWWQHGGFWIALTWLFFVAYVGLNVGLPNLMLKLAGPSERASTIAWYFALTGVVYGLCTIAGGALYSWLEKVQPSLDLVVVTLDYNELLFLAGFVLRATAVLWLLPIDESPRLSLSPPGKGSG